MRILFSSIFFSSLLLKSNGEREVSVDHRQGRRELGDATSATTHQWETRIIGGEDASIGKYPFFVQGSGCGASLIWKDIVLTAAHCKGNVANWRGRVLVGASEWSTEDAYSEWADVPFVNGEITHPDYDGDVYKDYMIVKLDEEVTNSNIQTVGLAGDTTRLQAGDPLTVIGFGATSQGGSGSSTLQEVQVDFASESRCNSVYGRDPAYDADFMFCAGGTPSGGTDSCQGDSGGPIIDQSGYLVGIVSWGYGCALPNTPGVYATVSAEIEWIKEMVCEHARNPPDWACDGGTSAVPPSSIMNNNPSPTPPSNPSPTPPTASNGPYNVKVIVAHDNFPEETSWSLVAEDGTIWLNQWAGTVYEDGQVVSEEVAVPAGEYIVTIEDTFSDGICCNHGNGSFQVSVDGTILYEGGDIGSSTGDLVFCIRDKTPVALVGECRDDNDNQGQNDNGDTNQGDNEKAEYYLVVEYDYWADETAVGVVHVATNEIVKVLPQGSVTEPYAFTYSSLDLIPGEEYQLIVTDEVGDGMPDGNPGNWPFDYGYAAVDLYVQDEWFAEMAYVGGLSFTSVAAQSFTVPTSIARLANRSSTERAKKTNKASFCNNSLGTFTTTKGVEKTCQWLEKYWSKTEPLCGESNVAQACPSTCGTCGN